jgi:hypothetical protein
MRLGHAVNAALGQGVARLLYGDTAFFLKGETMELQTAREIIGTLARGVDPVTGEVMPEFSPYNAPSVIRALFTAAKVLEEAPAAGKPRRDRTNLPANTGKAWTADDDEQLRLGFQAGTPTKDLAAALGRTRWAIESRLVKMGLLTLGGTAAAQRG